MDSDADDLADQWEIATTGSLTTLTSKTQDGDSDGLTNAGENAAETDPTVADTDGDGLSDGDEVNTYGSSPLKVDTDSDEMPDYWEATHGVSPSIANKFEDQDQDGYPNIFEYAGSSDPNNAASIPTPNYTVDASGGGTHTTVSAAVSAANIANGSYQTIGIAPGIYSGSANFESVTLPTSKPKFLIIGLEGASKTIFEGGTSAGWTIQNSAVIASLTIRNAVNGFYLTAPSMDVRLVDLVIRDTQGSSSYTSAIHAVTGYPVNLKVIGSTLLNNGPTHADLQVWLGSGSLTFSNSVVWGQTAGTAVSTGSGTTLTGNNSLVKGVTLTGSGNLGSTVDPQLVPDGHVLSSSPLRGAGGTITQSRVDMDGELRPTTAPDIGADQFIDSDSDSLPDSWETSNAGDLTTLTGGSQDADSDGLTNDEEYAVLTNPTVADTDGDGLSDADEIAAGANPLVTDTDGDGMPDGWEASYGLSPTLANAFDDDDGDRYPNIFEYTHSTDPSDRNSIPTPNYTVDASGGGTQTTVSAAISAASLTGGAYQIIGIAPGVYQGSANFESVTLPTSKPKFLIIGLEGAAQTIFDGGAGAGWTIQNSAVIASLTIRNAVNGFYLMAPSMDVRLVDVVVRDTYGSSSYTSAIHVVTGYPVNLKVIGATLLNNGRAHADLQVWLGSGTLTFLNSVVWGQTAGTAVTTGSGTTLTGNHSLVKGLTLTGTGNLAGTVDPGIRSDAHLRSDSPLRGAGGSIAQSRVDIDGELRPSSTPDIGVDQFVDSDTDDLPDSYEVAAFGDTTTVDGAADEDGDDVTNSDEYDLESNWLEPDSDFDGVDDGLEISLGMNPIVSDSDDLAA